MKIWKWNKFVITLLICLMVAMAIVTLVLRFPYKTWPVVFLITVILAAGFTFISGLLKYIRDLKDMAEIQEQRILELEKKLSEES
jgi:ABC-type enterochelin transport system permease subunit